MSVRSPRGRDHDLHARLPLRQVPVRVDRSRAASDHRPGGRAEAAAGSVPEVQGPTLEHAEAAPAALLKSCEQLVDEQYGVQWFGLWTSGPHLWPRGIFARRDESSFTRDPASRRDIRSMCTTPHLVRA